VSVNGFAKKVSVNGFAMFLSLRDCCLDDFSRLCQHSKRVRCPRVPMHSRARDSSQRYRRFGAQLLGKSYLELVSLAPLLQVFQPLRFRPARISPSARASALSCNCSPLAPLSASLGHPGEQDSCFTPTLCAFPACCGWSCGHSRAPLVAASPRCAVSRICNPLGASTRGPADCKSAIGSLAPARLVLWTFAPLRKAKPFRRFPSGSSQQITNLRYGGSVVINGPRIPHS